MPQPRITLVRYTHEDGKQLLRSFVFGGDYAGRRPPRGAPPECLAEMLLEDLKPDSPADAFMRALDAALFYERADILPQIRSMLTAQERDAADVERSAWRLRM